MSEAADRLNDKAKEDHERVMRAIGIAIEFMEKHSQSHLGRMVSGELRSARGIIGAQSWVHAQRERYDPPSVIVAFTRGAREYNGVYASLDVALKRAPDCEYSEIAIRDW